MKYDANRLGNGKKTMTAEQIEQYVEENAGTEYTAGDGISIVDNAISVDTTEIQEKLTAGNGISIVDDVISASGGAVQVPYTEWGTLVEEVDNTHFKFKSDVIISLISDGSEGNIINSLYYPKDAILRKNSFSIPAYTDLQSNSFALNNWYTNYATFIDASSETMRRNYYVVQFVKGNDANTFTFNYSSSSDTMFKSKFRIVKLN